MPAFASPIRVIRPVHVAPNTVLHLVPLALQSSKVLLEFPQNLPPVSSRKIPGELTIPNFEASDDSLQRPRSPEFESQVFASLA